MAVYNGTRRSGLASRAARTLTRHGFTVTRTGNTGNQNHAATFVQYGATLKSQAQKVSQLFPGAQLRQVTGPGIGPGAELRRVRHVRLTRARLVGRQRPLRRRRPLLQPLLRMANSYEQCGSELTRRTPAGRKPSRPAALCPSRRTPTHAGPTATTM
ncbi:LytR C-terminal domain-containing protein [Streptomyces mirabilis]